MSKYKVGDKVKVREDLNENIKCYSGVIYTMLKYKGKEVTIVNVFNDGDSYHINEDGGYYKWNDEMFKNTETETSEIMSIPNKGTIKYRITDDGITYTTLGHNSGKSVKSGKDESNSSIGILIATCRLLNISDDKIQDIIDILFEDDSNTKAKCDNAVMKNDIARALSILDKYKEV